MTDFNAAYDSSISAPGAAEGSVFNTFFKSVSDAGRTFFDEFTRLTANDSSRSQGGVKSEQIDGGTFVRNLQSLNGARDTFPLVRINYKDGQPDNITAAPAGAPPKTDWPAPTRTDLLEQLKKDDEASARNGMAPHPRWTEARRQAIDSLEPRDLENIGKLVKLLKEGRLEDIDRIVQQYDLQSLKLQAMFQGIVLELSRQGHGSRDFGVYFDGSQPRSSTLILIDRRVPGSENLMPFEKNADPRAIRYYTIPRIPTKY